MTAEIEIREEGEANVYALLNEKRWIASIRLNGEFMLEKQRKIIAKMATAVREKFSTTRCGASIRDSKCAACESPVIFMPDNTDLPEFGDDFLAYCANKGCINHAGTPYGPNGTDDDGYWIINTGVQQ